MALLSAYRYTSLSNHVDLDTATFRLLVLKPGEAADDISCTLEPCPIASAPDYEAISYVWGDPTDTRDITCSGYKLSITKNLHAALRRFRLTTKDRMLWADAICINQEDLDERGIQVSIMNQIYSQARQVLIWLGQEAENESEAIDVLLQLNSMLPPAGNNRKENHAFNTSQAYLRLMDHVTDIVPLSRWEHVLNFFRKPWFRRIWVLQEVVMARVAQIFIGPKSISWSTLADVVFKIIAYDLAALFTGSTDELLAARNVTLMHRQSSKMRRPFFKLLCSARNFQSTDPRDKIYALLGIPDAINRLRPDYTIPASEMFIGYTKQELIYNSLAHLSATNYTDDVVKVVVPTWVPDWSRSMDRMPFEAVNAPFNAGGGTVRHLNFSSDNNLLIIKGRLVSSIERLGTIQYSEHESVVNIFSTNATPDTAGPKLPITQWTLNWLNDCHKVAFGDDFSPTPQIFTSETYRNFCRALCCGIDFYSETPPLKTTVEYLSRLYSVVSQTIELQLNRRPLDDLGELETICLQVDRFVAPWSSHRYFCSDSSGRLSWVTRRARIGDLFCIFLGATVPHVLRPVGHGRYELIGECYLQGCMNGEVMETEKFSEEELIIV